MSGEHVLFVDDEQSIRKLLATYFERRGYRVEAVADGVEALRAIQEDPPGLVVTDANMPGLNGFELTRRLRANRRTSNIPIIMLSALKSEDDVLRGYGAGADEYVPKPVELTILAAKVETLLRRGREIAAAPVPERRSRVIAFLHGKGGVGATTLATNVAVLSATTNVDTVAMLDLDPQAAAAAMLLDLRPTRVLAELARLAPTEVDDGDLEELVARHQSGVRLLTSSNSPEMAELVTVAGTQRALSWLRGQADYVVVDGAPTFSEPNLAVIDAADVICLITTPRLTSLKATRDQLDVLATLGVPVEKTILCLNRTSPGGLDLERVGAVFKRRPTVVIPYTPAFDDVADVGRPFVLAHPENATTSAIRELVGKLAGVAAARAEPAMREEAMR